MLLFDKDYITVRRKMLKNTTFILATDFLLVNRYLLQYTIPVVRRMGIVWMQE